MREQLTFWMPWLLSAITLYITWMQGNKHKSSWLLGILNQVLWFTWIVASRSWGLLPMNLMLAVLYVRNHFKWNSNH